MSGDTVKNTEIEASDEISLLDLALTLVKHKRVLLGLPLIIGLIAVIVVLTIPNEYTATLRIAPSKNAAIYSWALNNESMNNQIAKEFKLAQRYGARSAVGTLNAVRAHVKTVPNTKDGHIDINVTDTDAAFAAQVANRYGQLLQESLYRLRLLDSSKLRYDYELRRTMALDSLNKYQLLLQQPEIAAMVSQLPVADRYGVTSLANIQAEMTLQGNLPDLMQNELIRLQDQLSSLQQLVTEKIKEKVPVADSGIWIATVNALQQEAYWKALVDRLDLRISLIKKQESDELKMTSADVPDEKSGPKRSLVVLLAILAGFIIAVFYSFVYEALVGARADRRANSLLTQITSAWKMIT